MLGEDAAGWIARDADVVWHGFTQMSAYAENEPLMVAAGEGRELIDVDGRRYLDAISSLWVNTLGHRVPELDAAVRDQLDRIAHSTMLGNGNPAVVALSEALASVVPVDRPHFLYASDGATAVEQALKVAFQHWVNVGRPERTGFLALAGAYHGDTVGALSLGDGGFGTDLFDPLRFPVRRAPSVAAAADLVREHGPTLAAAVVEPLVQGAGGMLLHEPADLADLAAACADTGTLLICDEVATGFGRTGTLFACEQAGVRPDLLVLGKGITGGYLPMSATVASHPVFASFLGPDLSAATLYHGHSYGGNALAAAVASAHLALFESSAVLANVRARSDQLRGLLDERVAGLPGVSAIRLRGLMCGVELAPPAGGLRWGRRVSAHATRAGVLLRPLGDVVVLMPILTSTAGEIERIVDALAGAIREVCG
ncbi:MAG: adenosylmethionine--8-amino-7-oxononanoate transaminase [Acidimicrobiia bacterium]